MHTRLWTSAWTPQIHSPLQPPHNLSLGQTSGLGAHLAAQLSLGGQTWRTGFSGPGSKLRPSGHRITGFKVPRMRMWPGTSSRRPRPPALQIVWPSGSSRLKGSQSWVLPSVGPGQAPQGALWIPSNCLDGRGPSLGPALPWEPQKRHLTFSWAALQSLGLRHRF